MPKAHVSASECARSSQEEFQARSRLRCRSGDCRASVFDLHGRSIAYRSLKSIPKQLTYGQRSWSSRTRGLIIYIVKPREVDPESLLGQGFTSPSCGSVDQGIASCKLAGLVRNIYQLQTLTNTCVRMCVCAVQSEERVDRVRGKLEEHVWRMRKKNEADGVCKRPGPPDFPGRRRRLILVSRPLCLLGTPRGPHTGRHTVRRSAGPGSGEISLGPAAAIVSFKPSTARLAPTTAGAALDREDSRDRARLKALKEKQNSRRRAAVSFLVDLRQVNHMRC
ncbi:hypothetical protein RRG08_054881 [Elysia crispata]|uniref:Uncharacterized protein n=1 Tax=Elysia crispata TaxID=231223 RepID=A0AAE1A7B0_9GAST|nr:hypothetical protein RRG08_054881 [Elysia crispata]